MNTVTEPFMSRNVANVRTASGYEECSITLSALISFTRLAATPASHRNCAGRRREFQLSVFRSRSL